MDASLIQDNNICIELDNILFDINSLGKAPIYYDPIDTKQHYPIINTFFSQDTIYRAFVVFCNNKSLILNDDIRTICQINPKTIYNKLTVSEQIQQLKEEGINYTDDLFQQLLTIVNLKNIVHININIIPQNPVQILVDILQKIESTSLEDTIPREFIEHFKNILDRYSIQLTEDDRAIRNFKNYLAKLNDNLLEKIEHQ